MSDDGWRSSEDSGGVERRRSREDSDALRWRDDSEERLRLGSAESGPLPHWSEPATGEVPTFTPAASADSSGSQPPPEDPTGEIDIWSAFSGSAESESSVEPTRVHAPVTSEVEEDFSGSPSPGDDEMIGWEDEPLFPELGDDRGSGGDVSGGVESPGFAEEIMSESRRGDEIDVTEPSRSSGRIQIGTDPTGDVVVGAASGERSRSGPRAAATRGRGGARGPVRPSTARAGSSVAERTGRNLPTAVAAALVLAAVFLGALLWRPAAVVVFVAAVMALAAVEYFGRVTEKGYRPATIAGLIACVVAPLAAYWVGEGAVLLVIVFGFAAAATGFVGATGVQSNPLPNTAVTMLGIVWIGVLGSFAALLAGVSAVGGAVSDVGTDTLFIVVVGVVANDVGALFVGSGIGRTPLRSWISPHKSVEGLIGGTVFTLLAVVLVGIQSDTWNDLGEWILLALVISVLAPLGDLVESMFKRNLDVKDFGTLVPGHGGVLDRFDAMLFVLPGAYYLLRVLEPWAS